MGVYTIRNSPYFWIRLEGSGERFSSKIPKHGATAEQTKLNRQLAEAVYDVSMGDRAREQFKLPSAAPARTFDAQAAWYLEHHTVLHRGAVQERIKIARLRAFFGSLDLKSITPDRWQGYVIERTQRDGVSMSTASRELSILKAILNTAVGLHLEFNPLATVKRKTTRLPAKRTISAAEDKTLIAELHYDDELRDLYVVGVGTLLRQSNLVTLQRHHVQGDRLVLGDTKTGPHRVPLTGPTPLQRRAAAVLKRRMAACRVQQAYLFPRWQARFAKLRDGANAKFLQSFRRACTRAGIPWGLKVGGVVWHTATRASGATRMLRDYKVDIRTVQLIGGWQSLDQMAEYLGIDLGVFGQRESA